MADQDKAVKEAKRTLVTYASEWGKSSLPPTVLATLITALHARPFQPLPMVFPPILLFSAYMNVNSLVIDSAGMTAAWSALYLLLANRRKAGKTKGFAGRIGHRFGARGLTRGMAMGIAAVNVVGGGCAYAFGKRDAENDINNSLPRT